MGVPHQACMESEEPGPIDSLQKWGPTGARSPLMIEAMELGGARASFRTMTMMTTRRPRPTSQATRSLDTASCWINLKMFRVQAWGVWARGAPPEATPRLPHRRFVLPFSLGPFLLALAFLSSCLFWVFLCLVVEGPPSGLGVSRDLRGPDSVCISFWLEPQTLVSHLVSGRIHLWSPLLSGLFEI